MKEVEKITRELLKQDFEIALSTQKEQLLSDLGSALIYLLLNDLEKLWNILYKIDVNEKKVKALFDLSEAKLIAPSLALLIYERMEQKAITRIQYRDKG